MKSIFGLFLIIFFSTNLFAQSSTDSAIYGLADLEGNVYIYHTDNLGFLNGFHVDRRVQDSDWERLTEFPVYSVTGGNEFESIAGEYMPILREATNRVNSQEVFLALLTRQSLNLIASSVYPEVALALGKLFIDEEPILNQPVEYRFVVVNSQQNPTGKVLSGSFTLNPSIPEIPINVTASNRGKEVTLNWEYESGSYLTDGVSRFIIIEQSEEEIRPLFEPGVYRIDGRESYSYRFEVDRIDREYTYSLVAVDVAGQFSNLADFFTIEVVDNIPPRRITGIQSSRFNEDTVELSWNVSIETKVVGYNIYRTTAGRDDFDLITQQPLEILENVYRDTSLIGGEHYRYYVTALDQNGLESEPSNISSIIIEEFIPPLPVSELQVQLTQENQVLINWTETESEEFNTYVILRKEIYPNESESFSRVNQSRVMSNEIIDRGIGVEFPEGVTYRYGVSVSGNSGLQSDTLFQDIHIPLVTPPEPPTDIIVNRGEGNRMNISWGASPSQTVTKYNVHKVLMEEGELSEFTFVFEDEPEVIEFIGSTGRGNRFVRENDLEPGFTYLYQVTAIDSAGNISEPLFSDLIYHRATTLPQAVRNLQARYINDEILLRWEPVSSSDLAAYRIYRSEISTGTLELVSEIDANVVTWQDTEGSPGLWYIVRAVDKSGNMSPRVRLTQATE